MTPNIPASIKGRLLKISQKSGEEFELFLVRYACERFLYRLGESAYRNRCVLKGAGLLSLWMSDPYRSTRDLDLLASGANDLETIKEVIRTICAVPCPEDGLRFDLSTVEMSPIRAEDEYQGQRVVLCAFLGKSIIRVQVDFGFGDAVTPGPEESDFPTLLPGLPAPRLRTYPRPVSVAEKFQAMVQIGRRNSRMKDFHDVWALSSRFDFDGTLLREAIRSCFERRATKWTHEAPEVLGAAFYGRAELSDRWRDYLRAAAFREAPPADFGSIGERIRGFLGPVRDSIVGGRPFGMRWRAGGPWGLTTESGGTSGA